MTMVSHGIIVSDQVASYKWLSLTRVTLPIPSAQRHWCLTDLHQATEYVNIYHGNKGEVISA